MAVKLLKYLAELRAARAWRRAQFVRFFPNRPSHIYQLVEAAGFSPLAYRDAWPDLVARLPTATWATAHYVQYLEFEVRLPRAFPIELRFEGMHRIADAMISARRHKASLLRNLIQARIDANFDCTRDAGFWREAFAVIAKVGRPLIVAGDSHSRAYRQTIASLSGCIVPINILCGGGSASGLSKPASRSGYGTRLREAFQAIAEATATAPIRAPIALNFGQVDVEFVHTYQRLRRKEFAVVEGAFAQFADSVVRGYVGWIADLPPNEYVVFGVNPPCVDDEFLHEAYRIQMRVYRHAGVDDARDAEGFGELSSEFANLRLPDKGERTRNHRLFNARLEAATRRAGLRYFGAFDEFLGRDGRIDPIHTFASDGTTLVAGGTGVDIHIGGKKALRIKARLARSVLASPAPATPRRAPS